jgi:hypothetical protein
MKIILYTIPFLFFLSSTTAQNVGIGTTLPKAKLDVKGDLILESKELVIPDGTIYQLDVNTNKFNHYKLTGPTGNFQIAGITAAEHDRTVALYNRTGVSLEVYNDDINTLPQDRILTGTGGTFAVYNGGNVVLKYDTLIAKWEVISGHYTNLDYFGSAAGEWTPNANDIYNINSGNVGIGTISPTAKLTVNGNLALQSDTIRVSCAFLPPPNMVIDNLAKNKSVLHIVADGCGIFYYTPTIVGLTGGADGKIVSLVSHVNNMQIHHLQGTTGMPSAADSLNMIELYEPNVNGPFNQTSSYTLNNGGSITLIYDSTRNRWKVLGVYGEVKTETLGWFKGPNPNDLYNPNSGNVGIGTGLPEEKLDVYGNAKVRNNLLIDGNVGINIAPVEKLDVNGNAKVRNNLLIDGLIGVGYPIPPYAVSVKKDGIGYYQENISGNTKLGLYTSANNFAYVGTFNNSDLRLGTNGADQFSIRTNGNVGIGFLSPNASLSVARGTGSDGTAAFFGTSNTSHFNYSTSEDTYIRGGKNTSKVYINDYGGQVAIGTSVTGTAQLNVVSSQTGAAANGISVLQTTTNTGNESYGVNLNVNGSNLRNFGILADAGGSGQTSNTAGLFRANGSSPVGENIGVEGQASNSNLHNYGGLFTANGGLVSTNNYGIYGEANGPGDTYGVFGYASTSGGASGSVSTGIYGSAPPIGGGQAGFFNGYTFVFGTLGCVLLTKLGGSFQIDHPQDPANKYLYHSFVESPDMMNIYNGNIITDNNDEAIVQLPEYFSALNKDFRYQLTVMGQFAQAIIIEEINDSNQFKIKTDKPNVKVSWQVTGIRQDAWANANRIVPEVEKEAKNKGKYLAPEVFGQPVEMGIHYVRPPKEIK